MERFEQSLNSMWFQISGTKEPIPTGAAMIAFGGVQLSALLLGTWFLYKVKKNKDSNIDDKKTKTTKKKKKTKAAEGTSPAITKKKNNSTDVWEERRRSGVLASSSSSSVGKNNNNQDKPFGSSYYYAHNNSNSKGGYADGLRMEDYTMNQPRLLSKGNSTVMDEKDLVEEEEEEEPKDNHRDQKDAATTTNTTNTTSPPPKNINIITHITRYQWDDPGTGIAHIRIDTVPGKRSTETVAWNELTVHDISAELGSSGDSLLVSVRASLKKEEETTTTYRLHIPQLYGRVSEIKTIPKAKRLLVRLQKEKQRWGGNKNIQSWPHPQKKIQ